MLPSATLPKASVETTFTTFGAVRWRVSDAASPSRSAETVKAANCRAPAESGTSTVAVCPVRTSTAGVATSSPV